MRLELKILRGSELVIYLMQLVYEWKSKHKHKQRLQALLYVISTGMFV